MSVTKNVGQRISVPIVIGGTTAGRGPGASVGWGGAPPLASAYTIRRSALESVGIEVRLFVFFTIGRRSRKLSQRSVTVVRPRCR